MILVTKLLAYFVLTNYDQDNELDDLLLNKTSLDEKSVCQQVETCNTQLTKVA